MASEIGEVELEDGEINDLEDGEIDEDILLATESNNSVFLPLEHRQRDSLLRDQHLNDNSYAEKNRDFGFQDSSPPPDRWDTRGVSSSRGRFPRARASVMVRGSRTRGKGFRGTGRGMISMRRGKTFPAKRGNPRSPFPQRPNLPHPPSDVRLRSPYLDKRVSTHPDNEKERLPYSPPDIRSWTPQLEERGLGYSDTDRPRLPHTFPFDRERVPLMELDDKSRSSHNEKTNSTPVDLDEQPRRLPSPLDEDVDDYRILLQRHRLIQQHLAALENQENSTLGDDNIIDDTFVDIPVEDTQPNLLLEKEKQLQSFSDQLDETYQLDYGRQDGFQSHEDVNIAYFETGSEINDFDKRNEMLNNEMSGETGTPKPFLPFKIKPRYGNVPSIKELSQKDLEQRTAKQQSTTKGNGSENTQTLSQNSKRGNLSKVKKNRRKRKRKVSQNARQSNINSQPVGASGSNQGSHVDPYNELEARLMSLAGNSVSVEPNREDDNKKRERREKLRQWQEKMNRDKSSDLRNQQGNKGRGNKKLAKPTKDDKRRASLQSLKSDEDQRDRDPRRRTVNSAMFESDDYFEIPMDVESDSPDGPALPLIDETAEDFPPPPPPLPSGDSATSLYVDPGQHPVMMYPPGYFPMEQNYTDWLGGAVPVMSAAHDDQQFQYGEFARDESYPAEVERNDEQPQFESKDVSSQDNSDEDDEAALREQLLKSLAVKRKAKLDVGDTKSSKSASVTRNQGVQSSNTAANNRAHQAKQQQNSRQVSFVAPPKHDPVVIKLGEDSDTDESDVSDTESAKKPASKSKGSRVGGLYGGLEMMIKEARKSAEASKVKVTASPQATDTEQQDSTELSPEPTTPDAMAHMPEQMKTEYKKLKEQLALRESKTRQPLTTVNQEKEDSCPFIASEDQVESVTRDDNRHLKDLYSYVAGCEENLSKHRKLIEKDKGILNKMVTELIDKKRSLAAQEEIVRKLQQDLEAAQKVTLANRMLVSRLQSKTKLIKERLRDKQLVASNFEEELLRAKSIISAVKRKMPIAGDTGSGRNSPQVESSGSVSNENQKFTITSSTAQDIKNSLDAKLNKLSSLTRLEKRKLEGASESSSEETVAKKQKGIPQGSPASSAPSTPRKSATAERIAQEKARLKKLEHELSEKLKLYVRQDEGKSHSSVSPKKPSQNNKDISDVKRSEREEKQPSPDGAVSGNSTHPTSERPDVDSRGQSSQLLERQKAVASPKDSEKTDAMELNINAQQMERIRKLQAEKEKRGPQFSASDFDDIPLTAHQRSTLCVCLPFGCELKNVVTDQDTAGLGGEEHKGTDTVTREINRGDGDEVLLCPLEKYQSQLLHLKSYRLSPYFRIQGGYSLTSLTFSNKLNPLWPLCNFDLQGKCNDEDCKFQHFITCKLSQEEILQDLAAYNPNLTVDCKDLKELQENVESFTKAFTKQYQDKMSWDELCILLVNEVRKHRKGSGPFNVSLQPRAWQLWQTEKKQVEYMEEDSADDLGKGIVFSRKDKMHDAVSQPREAVRNQTRPAGEESQEIRYFLEEYNNIEALETSLENSPGDVALWIKLARLKLHQNSDDTHAENNIRQALSTLARGLEENAQSEELWLEYLELYSSQSNRDELREICDQAVEFSPTYSVWWKYLEYSQTYHDKRTVCLRLISFLTGNPSDVVELEFHSHCILETLLYLIQLELYSGHYKSALAVFKAAIAKKPGSCTEVPELSNHLLPSDFCFAWLAYIHVFEFHRLPAAWFDPRHGKPSRMVTKEDFVFPWKPSQQSRTSGEKLLVMFQDALKACSALAKSSSDKLTICLPLYKNLIALERAYGRIDSARGICRHLLKDNPSAVVLWLCLAALEDSTEKGREAEQVYLEALDECKGHAELSYSVARFYLEQNEVQKAVSVLVKCARHKFAAVSEPHDGQIHSLATVPSENQGADLVALYRRLLLQPLPYDYKCPPLMPGVNPQSLDGEKLFLWLSYCLLLEISSPATSMWDNLSVASAFETAVHSPLERQDVQTLWTEYLLYQRSKASQGKHFMDELVNRCLMSVSTHSSLPHSSSAVWQDYRFHNQIISISLSCHPQSSWSSVFKTYLRLFPGSVSLALRACKHEMEKKNFDQAKKISARFLSENPHSISMWKVAISIELQRNCVKEARKMYQQATEILPFAATLWKDFLMFELARSGNGSAVQEILVNSRHIGVELEEFLNTLLGK